MANPNHRIHHDLQSLWICICECVCVPVSLCSSHTEKRSRMWTSGGINKKGCVGCFFWLGVFQHVKIGTFASPCICSWVLMFLALREPLNTLRSAGCCVSEKRKRSNINTEPLCYQQSQPVRQQSCNASAEMNSLARHLRVWEAEWMVAKHQPFRHQEEWLYF